MSARGSQYQLEIYRIRGPPSCVADFAIRRNQLRFERILKQFQTKNEDHEKREEKGVDLFHMASFLEHLAAS